MLSCEECGATPLCVGCGGLLRCEHRATLPIPRRLWPTLLAVAIPSIGVCQAMSNVDTGLRGYVDFIARAKALCTAVSPPACSSTPFIINLTRGRRGGYKKWGRVLCILMLARHLTRGRNGWRTARHYRSAEGEGVVVPQVLFRGILSCGAVNVFLRENLRALEAANSAVGF